MAITLKINGKNETVTAAEGTPLLWVLRDHLGLTGTKFGCGIAMCGACTVHLDGLPFRSCRVPASVAIGKSVTTIEGLSSDGDHPVQIAWKEFDVPQCGYCQSGQIIAATAFLAENPNPADADIDAAMTNLCRCGSYPEIRAAIRIAVRNMNLQRVEN